MMFSLNKIEEEKMKVVSFLEKIISVDYSSVIPMNFELIYSYILFEFCMQRGMEI